VEEDEVTVMRWERSGLSMEIVMWESYEWKKDIVRVEVGVRNWEDSGWGPRVSRKV